MLSTHPQIRFSDKKPRTLKNPVTGRVIDINYRGCPSELRVFQGLLKMRAASAWHLRNLKPEQVRSHLIQEDRVSLIDDLIKSYGFELL